MESKKKTISSKNRLYEKKRRKFQAAAGNCVLWKDEVNVEEKKEGKNNIQESGWKKKLYRRICVYVWLCMWSFWAYVWLMLVCFVSNVAAKKKKRT